AVTSATSQDCGNLSFAAVNGDGFVDGNRAVCARTEGVNLASGGGLAQGAGKGLARSCEAARVGIIPCSCHPRAGLGMNDGSGQHYKGKQRNRDSLPHIYFLLLTFCVG